MENVGITVCVDFDWQKWVFDSWTGNFPSFSGHYLHLCNSHSHRDWKWRRGRGGGFSTPPYFFQRHSELMHFKIPRHSIPSDVDDIARKTCGNFWHILLSQELLSLNFFVLTGFIICYGIQYIFIFRRGILQPLWTSLVGLWPLKLKKIIPYKFERGSNFVIVSEGPRLA